jgi:glycosyltransferase involved in cell wall biosynthesis
MNSAVKLLVISDYRDFLTSRPEAELLIGLQKEGLEVTVMTYPDTPYEPVFKSVGIKVIPFHPNKKRHKAFITKIREELIRGQYDLLHIFNSLASSNGIPAAKGLPVKVILYRGYTGNIHWYDFTQYFKYFHPRVDSIFCINKEIENIFRRNKLFGRHKAVTIIKGHNPDWYTTVNAASLTAYHIPENAFVVICVANVRPMKGIPVLLKATQHLSPNLPIHFLLVGSGFDHKNIEDLIKKSPYSSNIHIAGFLKDPLPLVAASSLFVLPSLRGEGLSKSTIEAMSLAKPVVITRIPGNTDLVEDGDSGVLVTPGNPLLLAKAIERVYRDKNFREKISAKAVSRMKSEFHIDKTIRELKAHYLFLLNKTEI